MAFTTWAAELTRFKNALADRDPDTLLKSGWTTSDGQVVTFTKLSELTAYGEWLENKVNQAANAGGRRTGFFTVGFRGR